jgi:hypothetical protein
MTYVHGQAETEEAVTLQYQEAQDAFRRLYGQNDPPIR